MRVLLPQFMLNPFSDIKSASSARFKLLERTRTMETIRTIRSDSPIQKSSHMTEAKPIRSVISTVSVKTASHGHLPYVDNVSLDSNFLISLRLQK